MYCIKFCFSNVIVLIVVSMLYSMGTDHDLTFYVSAQLGVENDLRSGGVPSDPEGLVESIGSPGTLMDSVLNEVRNTDASKTSFNHSEGYTYSLGENILLSHQIIPAKDFLHLFGSRPFGIVQGSISTKLPCDSDNSTQLRIMIGQIPELYPANLSMEKDLSRPGYMCLYNFEIGQNLTKTGNTSSIPITDIVLFNSGDERSVLPNTSTFVIGVTKLYYLKNATMPAT